VKQKRINIICLIIFSWSALIGATGGLLICIHDDMRMHAEVGEKAQDACDTAHASSETPRPSLEAKQNCLDIEFETVQTVLVKTEQFNLDHNCSHFAFEDTNFDFGLILWELAPDCQAQAPPGLTSVSVRTVKLTQLRI
jgi:hypothetical protein